MKKLLNLVEGKEIRNQIYKQLVRIEKIIKSTTPKKDKVFWTIYL